LTAALAAVLAVAVALAAALVFAAVLAAGLSTAFFVFVFTAIPFNDWRDMNSVKSKISQMLSHHRQNRNSGQ
jgi:hypothetical protein